MRAWNWLPLTAAIFAATTQAATPNNEKLADVMNLLTDQVGGISDVSKKAPADVDARSFKRAISRARGGQWILGVLAERAGKIVDGKFVSAELTPGKFLDVTGADLEALAEQYAKLLTNASAKFVAAEAALKKQAALEAPQRDFTELKAVAKDLTTAMIAGHQIFKP